MDKRPWGAAWSGLPPHRNPTETPILRVRLSDTLSTGFGALGVHPLRSALTMLGIAVGVAAVIAMAGIGAGAREEVARQFESLGSDLILVGQGSITRGGVRRGAGAAATLGEDDAAALERDLPEVMTAAPTLRGRAALVAERANWSADLFGVTPAYMDVREWRIAAGRDLGWEDVAGAAKVVVLGETAARRLFGDASAVGHPLRIGAVPFTVVGTLVPKGPTPYGQDQDDAVFLPLTTARASVLGVNRANPQAVAVISVKMWPGEEMEEAERRIRALLRQRHRLESGAPGSEDDFWLRNLTAVAAGRMAAGETLSRLLAAVAAVSLLVGGVGTMNIMLVAVTERTREIGLRLALGARRRDIRGQFLVEAALLTLCGGLAGVALGAAGAWGLAAWAGWPVRVPAEAVLLTLAVSAATGLFFGLYPAHRAALLRPVEALRQG